MKKVLLIARAFPPFLPVGHSIRVIKFIKYLPMFGWQPSVLTVDNQEEYETLPKVGSASLLEQIDPLTSIHRTLPGEPSIRFLEKEKAFGNRNHITALLVKIFGGARRWAFRNLFLPDRMLAWLPFAVVRGWRIVRQEKVDVIVATCPPHSATLVGAVLKKLTATLLLLDYRDDWIDTPWFRAKPKWVRWVELHLEHWAVSTADSVILVTEWSRNAFRQRYPDQPAEKFVLIPNGCDLQDFSLLDAIPHPRVKDKFIIVHAGSLNVSSVWGRSPAGLFEALQKLLHQKPTLCEKIVLKFAGDLPDEFLSMANQLGLANIVQGVGHLPHSDVVRLMKEADLLLAMNYEGWETLIPGKIYEYWATGGPPILLLSCPGAAQDFVAQHRLGYTADPYDSEAIEIIIAEVYRKRKAGTPIQIQNAGVEAYDRKALTQRLVQVMESALSSRQKPKKETRPQGRQIS